MDHIYFLGISEALPCKMFLITAANKNYIPQRSLGIRIRGQSFSEIFTPVAILDTVCKDVIRNYMKGWCPLKKQCKLK